MKRLSFILLAIFIVLNSFAQSKMKLSLEEALSLAQTRSLQSFLVKNNYLTAYWQHKSFKANYLPSLSFDSKLLSYTNANNLEYNSQTQTRDFVRNQTLKSDASLALAQNVALTGGTFYVRSDLTRFQNYGKYPYSQFSSRPFRIGYKQNLFGYNRFKWERKLEPKKYKQAVQQYLQDVEQTNKMGCDYFFRLAVSRVSNEMAEYNYFNTDTLFQVAQKRFQLGTIQQEDLLELELNLNNASIKMEEAKIQYRRSKDAFISFFRLAANTDVDAQLPDVLNLQIPVRKALELAKNNNAHILNQQVLLLEAQRRVAEVRSKNRFQASLDVSYGINKSEGFYDHRAATPVNGKIGDVYKSDFDQYQQLGIGVSIPILDWGKRKGRYQMAKSRQEATRISVEQKNIAFEQELVTKIMEFNLQYNKVKSAVKSDHLATNSYELTSTRFKRGNVDVLKLTSSQKAKDNARLQYIRALSQYWSDYYTVRMLTLYDFKNNQTLEEDLEKLLDGLVH